MVFSSEREMQCLQRGFLLRQALLPRAAEYGRDLCASWRGRVLPGIAGGWMVGGGRLQTVRVYAMVM